jgi:hypothetical protein
MIVDEPGKYLGRLTTARGSAALAVRLGGCRVQGLLAGYH